MPKDEGEEPQGRSRAYEKRLKAEGGSRAAARDANISAIIGRVRTASDVSQERCAAYLGVSRPFYSKFELGETALSVGQVEALLDLLNIRPAEVWPLSRGQSPDMHVAVAPGETVYIIVEGGKKTRIRRWERGRKNP